MQVIGIVAEYNPFHNGHLYQIETARRTWGQDIYIVVVMSGNFVQRGEPAIASKWIRAQSALACGADLIIEIPFTFACASAERFASGAITLLASTGIVTDLLFGSESSDLALLQRIAKILQDKPDSLENRIRTGLQEGLSYPAAREAALIEHLQEQGHQDLIADASAALRAPNSILAIEYLIACQKTGYSITPRLLPRAGSGYHEKNIQTPLPSASAIRKAILNCANAPKNSPAALANTLIGTMPSAALAPILSEWSSGIRPVFPEHFAIDSLLAIRSRSTAEIDNTAYMNDHVSGRIRNASAKLRVDAKTNLHQAFQEEVHTRRYAQTRINRALISLLCGQTASDLSYLTAPKYLRILGFSKSGRYLLRKMKTNATLPIISKASDFLEQSNNPSLSRMAALDLLSADIWNSKAGYPYADEYDRQIIHAKDIRGNPPK